MSSLRLAPSPQTVAGCPRASGTRRRVAIVQSNYIPWKGYFDLINQVDEFLLYDEVQYTRRDWRNRNQVKTPHGLHWLSIPVQVKGKFLDAIDQMTVADARWAPQHWRTVAQSYGKLDTFGTHGGWLEKVYTEAARLERLTDINELFLRACCQALGVATQLRRSSELGGSAKGKNERLVELCALAGATEYLSGPAARGYLDEASFAHEGIAVRWMNYDGYSPYPQPHGPFSHAVSIVDLLLCTGSAARAYALREAAPT